MNLNELEKYQIGVLLEQLKKLYPNELNESSIAELKSKMINSNQDFTTLSRELNLAFQNETKLEGLLFKYQLKAKEKITEKVEEKTTHALNMSEITDFIKDGKTYIKITYQDGRVQIIENRNGKDTTQIFRDIQRLKALNNIDGTMSTETAFRELLKDYKEVTLDNAMFINQEKLNLKEQSKLNFVQMNFPNNKVLASASENIFIIKGSPDITVEVIEQDGRYLLKQLGETNYGVNENNNEMLKIDSAFEKSNDIKEHSIEELEKITEGMTEEEIVEYLKIHGKNQQQIMMILLALEEAKSKKVSLERQLEKPKQMVLTNPNMRKKMAAFVDTLYLAFLVGMISGATFFAILRVILHSL